MVAPCSRKFFCTAYPLSKDKLRKGNGLNGEQFTILEKHFVISFRMTAIYWNKCKKRGLRRPSSKTLFAEFLMENEIFSSLRISNFCVN